MKTVSKHNSNIISFMNVGIIDDLTFIIKEGEQDLWKIFLHNSKIISFVNVGIIDDLTFIIKEGEQDLWKIFLQYF